MEMNEYDYDDVQENHLVPIQDGAILQMEKAQIDMQIATAKKYPRNLQRVKRNMLAMATIDEDTAKSCFFVLPRSGKAIEGKSVRMAEIALSCFGNVKAGTRVVDVQDKCDNPHVVVQAVTIDLENNVAVTIEKRRRITKKKNKPAIDEDDINLAVNACSAIAFRDAVFKVIPGALTKPVYDAAVKMATGGEKPIESRIANAIEQFAKMGVFEDRILLALKKQNREELVQDDLVKLIGYFTGIRDGETTIEECFPRNVADSVSPLESAKKPEPKPEPQPTTPTEKPEIDVTALAPAALVAAINRHKKADYFAEVLEQFGAATAQELTDDQKRECLTSLMEAEQA
jgi:cyclophilin family peptidyl-prolyl cis-trans isomerase